MITTSNKITKNASNILKPICSKTKYYTKQDTFLTFPVPRKLYFSFIPAYLNYDNITNKTKLNVKNMPHA